MNIDKNQNMDIMSRVSSAAEFDFDVNLLFISNKRHIDSRAGGYKNINKKMHTSYYFKVAGCGTSFHINLVVIKSGWAPRLRMPRIGVSAAQCCSNYNNFVYL